MKRPQGNQSPVVASVAVVSISLLVLLAGGTAIGIDPYMLGTVAFPVVMAGVVLGAWASQAATPWSRGGYLWRFGVALIVVITLGLLCGVPVGRAPT